MSAEVIIYVVVIKYDYIQEETIMQLGVRLWTVEDYHRLVAAGILHPEERVELIEGQIVRMAAAITRTARVLVNGLGEQVLLRTQESIRLNDYSEPEPDVAVVQVNPLDYADHHPTPEEVYLVIEVVDSSLSKEREIKARIYAQAGIADYWILDINQRQLFVLRTPSQNGYQNEFMLTEDAIISPLRFPNLSVAIQDILPPRF